jgi:hypothetical protein
MCSAEGWWFVSLLLFVPISLIFDLYICEILNVIWLFSLYIKIPFCVILAIFVIGQSSESLQHHGLNVFHQLLRDSISNRASCVRAGMLNFLLDWFSQENNDSVISKIAQLIQVIGGHSISGKEIRKIFALLRSEKVGSRQQYSSLLLTTVLSMLNEKGPTAFFDLNGNNSVSPYAILKSKFKEQSLPA